MKPLLKIENDDFAVEFEMSSVWDDIVGSDSRMQELERKIHDVDSCMEARQQQIDRLNEDIDRLTNHADGVDYMVAVMSGIITGLIDSFIVGEWNFAKAKAESNKNVNNMVMDFAKKHGYTGDRLDGAIAFLEKKFRLPGDGAYQFNPETLINAKTHHLDDFCHHPTLVGLICNVIVQFTGESVYVNKDSDSFSIPISVNEYGQFQGNNTVTKLFCGIINWIINAAKAMANGYGHWMSDIAGSSSAQKGGAGLPGPILSMLKELSALPVFKESNFGELLRRAFQNGIGSGPKQIDLGAFNSLFEGASSKLDFRTEMAVFSELKRQALPVVINEVIVRGFYFVRRFMFELKECKSLSDINWRKVMPFNNRTVIRMLTIATGTFTAFDIIDATIRASIKSGGNASIALADVLLRVNFVGVGRFAVAVFSDIKMGFEKKRAEGKVLELEMDQLKSLGVKLYYCQEETWVMADNCLVAYKQLAQTVEKTIEKNQEAIKSIQTDTAIVGERLSDIAKNDSKFARDLLDDLF